MTAKTAGKILTTAERRAFVLRMRKAGANYIEIANAAVKQFGECEKIVVMFEFLNQAKREIVKIQEAQTAKDATEIAGG